jgi:riboflavin kinase/FMN adenylyltransferase
MKVLRSTLDIGAVTKGCVLSIGNFDGVHIGHQAILDVARTMARERGGKAIAMVFEPHPVAVLHPEKALGVLTPLVWKLSLLSHYADDCVLLESTKELLSMPPADFVGRFLQQMAKPSVVVEGEDFHFGFDRSGSVETLRQLGRQKGFEVVVVPARQIKLGTGQLLRVSSTIIRYMIESGHVGEAAMALSRPYRLMGMAVRGKGRGRQLGFPTINMQKPSQIIPAEGVYAGFVEIADTIEDLVQHNERLPAVFSIGQARTFGDEHPLLIESHLLVEDVRDVSEKMVAMDFVQYLRSQHKFSTPQELAGQIARDCQIARVVLQSKE